MAFPTAIDLQPIPVDARTAARQALLLQAKVDAAGGIDAAVTAAVDAIYATKPTDAPSELKRLRLLYQRAYDRAELEALVLNTFAALGIRSE